LHEQGKDELVKFSDPANTGSNDGAVVVSKGGAFVVRENGYDVDGLGDIFSCTFETGNLDITRISTTGSFATIINWCSGIDNAFDIWFWSSVEKFVLGIMLCLTELTVLFSSAENCTV
jgi:hypothetical protein